MQIGHPALQASELVIQIYLSLMNFEVIQKIKVCNKGVPSSFINSGNLLYETLLKVLINIQLIH